MRLTSSVKDGVRVLVLMVIGQLYDDVILLQLPESLSFGAQQWRIQCESPGKIPKPLIYYTNHAVIDRLVVNKEICD